MRSMALSIPAAIGLLSVLQDAFKTSDGNRVCLTSHTHWIVEDMGTRPTTIDELVQDEVSSTQGACDASKKGLGSVHFVPLPNGQIMPFYGVTPGQLRSPQKFSPPTTRGGTITNSDLELELAATIAQFDVLAQAFDIRSHTIYNLFDNAVTIDWQKKGAASTSGWHLSLPPPCASPTASSLPPSPRLHSGGGQRSFRSMFSSFSSHRFPTPCSFQLILPSDNALVHVPPAKRDAFQTDLSLVQEKTQLGVIAKRAKAADAHWVRWEKFCLEHSIDPFLKHYNDPIPII
jgi:hypothetical protein